MWRTHQSYHSDPCNPQKLNKRFFSAVVILVLTLVVLPVAHIFFSPRSTETEFLCIYLRFYLVWEAGSTFSLLTISSNFIPASSDFWVWSRVPIKYLFQQICQPCFCCNSAGEAGLTTQAYFGKCGFLEALGEQRHKGKSAAWEMSNFLSQVCALSCSKSLLVTWVAF